MLTWEEDFLGGPRAELHDNLGKLIGEVRKVGGSWEVVRVKNGFGETVAIRPDKISAQQCLGKLIEAEPK